eukprot:3298107-Ditylum_brightwellii.AAC.1
MGEAENRTYKRVTRLIVSNGFAFDTVFLTGEDKMHVGDIWYIGGLKMDSRNPIGLDVEANVGEAEGG